MTDKPDWMQRAIDDAAKNGRDFTKTTEGLNDCDASGHEWLAQQEQLPDGTWPTHRPDAT